MPDFFWHHGITERWLNLSNYETRNLKKNTWNSLFRNWTVSKTGLSSLKKRPVSVRLEIGPDFMLEVHYRPEYRDSYRTQQPAEWVTQRLEFMEAEVAKVWKVKFFRGGIIEKNWKIPFRCSLEYEEYWKYMNRIKFCEFGQRASEIFLN